jgi:hypothetical protein
MSKKSKPKPIRAPQESEPGKDDLIQTPTNTLKPKYHQIAVALASLAAGIMFLVNFDRVTNASTARELGAGTSLHGWPFVYLERKFESLPAFLAHTRASNWPFPISEGETRSFNYLNLGLDVLCAIVVVCVCFYLVRAVVFKYEQWKKSW